MSWAKAPDFADDPARVDAIRRQTARDKHHYLDDGLTPVECRSCVTRVLVRKNSVKHTSVQWTGRPSQTCPVFRDSDSATQDSCPRMSDSIEHAVMEGRFEQRQD